MSNHHPALEPCPVHYRVDCPVHLNSRGWCWFGDHYPKVNAQVEGETEMEATTVSMSVNGGEPTEPITLDEFIRRTAPVGGVDPETGEVQEPAGQMVLGDDPAFVRPTRRRDVPTVKVTFAGTVELEQEEFEALTDGKELAPGRVVYIRASAYMPGPHVAWVKRTEKDEDTGERESWWEHQGRLALKVTEIGGLDVTDREWSDD